MAEASGFSWTERKNGDVVISRHGREVTTLRGPKAARFVETAHSLDEPAAQNSMARLTGNYKRGNER